METVRSASRLAAEESPAYPSLAGAVDRAALERLAARVVVAGAAAHPGIR